MVKPFSPDSEHAKVADWLDDQARIATNSLHCGDNSMTIQRTHDWANRLEAAARHLRTAVQSSSADSERVDWMAIAEAGLKVRLEAQAPTGRWIAIFPAQLEQMIEQGLPVRATEVTGDPAQAVPVPDLLATTLSYSYRTITIECGSLELRDEIYDWLMQQAATLSSTEGK